MTRSGASPDGGDFEFYSCAEFSAARRGPKESEIRWRTAVARLNLSLSTDIGNAKLSRSRAPKPMPSARGTLEMTIFSPSRHRCPKLLEHTTTAQDQRVRAHAGRLGIRLVKLFLHISRQLGYGFSAAIFRIARISRAPKGVAPHPVPDFRHVLTVPGNILLVLEEFVLELLLQVDALVAGLR